MKNIKGRSSIRRGTLLVSAALILSQSAICQTAFYTVEKQVPPEPALDVEREVAKTLTELQQSGMSTALLQKNERLLRTSLTKRKNGFLSKGTALYDLHASPAFVESFMPNLGAEVDATQVREWSSPAQTVHQSGDGAPEIVLPGQGPLTMLPGDWLALGKRLMPGAVSVAESEQEGAFRTVLDYVLAEQFPYRLEATFQDPGRTRLVRAVGSWKKGSGWATDVTYDVDDGGTVRVVRQVGGSSQWIETYSPQLVASTWRQPRVRPGTQVVDLRGEEPRALVYSGSWPAQAAEVPAAFHGPRPWHVALAGSIALGVLGFVSLGKSRRRA